MKLYLCGLALAVLVLGCQCKVDKTRVERKTGKRVVEAVVDMITESCIFEDDALFLRRIAFVETRDGNLDNTFLRNGTEYYGGIWQVDEAMFDETKNAVGLFPDIQSHFNIDWSGVQWEDLLKPLYSGLAARIAIHQMAPEVPRSTEDQAALWTEEYQSVSADVEAMKTKFVKGCDKLDSKCGIPEADLVFVLDASTSIKIENFVLMKEFVASVVDAFDVGQSSVRVGLITYSSKAKVEFDLEEYDDKDDLMKAIRDTHYLTGSTNSKDALRQMSKMFTKQGRGGTGVPEIGIFMTDGKSQDTAGTAQAADEVHAQQLTVFSVGITDGVNTDEVEKIGTDPDCVHVYYLKSFADVTHFAKQIERQACKAPAELVLGETVSNEILLGSEYHFKTEVSKSEGATVEVEMVEGSVDVYLSYDIRNPSEVVHDQHFIASSATGPSGMYLPFPDQTVCEGECKGIKKRSTEDPDEKVELYGTVVGMTPGMKNWYQLKVTEGWGLKGSALATSVSVISLVAPLLITIMATIFY